MALAVEIARLYGKHAAHRFDYGRTAEAPGHRTGIERRRHRDHAEVFAQGGLGLAHQRKRQIAVQAALVQFVEDHAADVFQRGIVLQHPQEQAVGHDLDAGARADLGIEPHAIAHRLADLLAERSRHAPRRGARRQTPRLLHHDLSAGEPRRVEQRQRHARRLACARRRHQHGRVAPFQRRLQAREGLVDGKRVHRGGLYGSGAHRQRHARPVRRACPWPGQSPRAPSASAGNIDATCPDRRNSPGRRCNRPCDRWPGESA